MPVRTSRLLLSLLPGGAPSSKRPRRRAPADLALHLLLRAFAAAYRLHPRLRRHLHGVDGPLRLVVGFRTESGSVRQALRIADGRVRVLWRIPEGVDATLVFQDEGALREMLSRPPNEVMLMLLRSRLRVEGNTSVMSLFNFLLSLPLTGRHRAAMRVARERAAAARASAATPDPPAGARPPRERLAATPSGGVRHLEDPYLSRYRLADFPRLAGFLDAHFEAAPEICVERPLLLTRWFREHGFERRASDGRPWSPALRQAHAFRHLMAHKAPLVREGDLLGGTTTAREVGVVLYPDAHGTLIWGELGVVCERALNPYVVRDEDVALLHGEILPFWVRRNFREHVRDRWDEPLCQRLDERFAVYFAWKSVALSHTIADIPRLLREGTRGLERELDRRLAAAEEAEARHTLEAMKVTLEGLVAYAHNLSAEAARLADEEHDATRAAELRDIAHACRRVPEEPARTLHEALQAIWIVWVGLHMENTNAGLSIGRLDQWLQPFFEADLAALRDDEQARARYVQRAVELVGCFYLRCADHLPLVPDIGNHLFGGSSSDQAITLGGVTPEGDDAVNDMTYVLLAVTELLKLRDPNVNARYSASRNDDAYLRRLCEVNLVTAATPSIHGDENVMAALAGHGYAAEDLRDWSAVGCVEPTLSGKHMGHTGCLMFNMVAALEMALRDGLHPLMRWQVGPRTGAAAEGAFGTFEDVWAAFEAQLRFLVDQAVDYNNMLGAAHAELRPTPLLSSLIDGCAEAGRDATRGGARYNSSGVACIGLADVVDSLAAIRTLVFDEGRLTLPELMAALDVDFEGHPRTHALLRGRVRRFGSGDDAAVELANRVAGCAHDAFAAHRNFRGGPYTTGFWSMSNHVAFGTLTGALPSGRRAGKAFTPGLTPSPDASSNLLDVIRDVGRLEPRNLDNSVAFNVKYVPSAADDHATAVEHMVGYAKAYFRFGGLQMQLNVVDSATLRDAMAHPERYRDLLVRISGYNAYFVTLNREMQIELIERAEFRE